MGLPSRDLSNATNRPQRTPQVSSRHPRDTPPRHAGQVQIAQETGAAADAQEVRRFGFVIGLLVAWAALSLVGLAITVEMSNAGLPTWASRVPGVAPVFLAYPATRWALRHLHPEKG